MRTNTKFVLLAVSIALIAFAGAYAIKTNIAVAPSDGVTNTTGIETSSPFVRLITPKPNDEIENLLIVQGEARGNWYFEASFPVRLLDGNGKEIAVTPARAIGDWMTTNFVPFRAKLMFIAPNTKEGTLVLQKDNPSGLPENAGEVKIPIHFKNSKDTTIAPSGIHATVTIGPTCPVMRIPPDPQCADKPHKADFKITKKDSLFSKTISSGSDGVLNMELSPGEYTISAILKNVMPRLNPVEFTVTRGNITELTLQFDSGIR
ncbi:MAG: hypothetical protein HZB09_00450 [Candidatus Yonathbacteria bacterium]|nr:hypothetical protein [Candidatus Yonathbacteria bacterium]